MKNKDLISITAPREYWEAVTKAIDIALASRKIREEIEELEAMIATLDQENRQLHARNERLMKELSFHDSMNRFEQSILDGRNH